MRLIQRRSRKSWILFLIIFAGFILFLTFLYLRLLSVRSEAAKEVKQDLPVPVRVVSAEKTDGWLYREVIGRIEGAQEIDIRTNVNGWVDAKNFQRGDTVDSGDVLVELEDERTQAAYSEAMYNLESAKAKLNESRRKLAQNRILLEKGIISKDAMQESENQVNIDSANVNSLEASLKRARFNYDKLRVRSPIDGQLVEIVPDIGQEVLEGEVIARVVNISKVRVVAGVDASLARSLKNGLTVDLSLKLNGKSEAAKGIISGISKNFADNTGIYEVEVDIRSENINWWPGEIVSIRFPVKKYENVVKVPRSAVLSDSSELFVFIVKNGRTMKLPVEITWLNDEFGYVGASQIPIDSRIIEEGAAGLTSGQQVRILN